MKKMLAILLGLVMLFACASALGEDEGIIYDDGNPQLSPEFYLPGNPTTGYTWIAEGDDETIVRVLVEYDADDDRELAGAPGNFWIRIDGLKPGLATVTLSYARPWENAVPLYSFTVQVDVDEELNVNIWQIEMKMAN